MKPKETISTKDPIAETAKETIITEGNAVMSLVGYVNNDFEKAVKMIFESKGRLIVSGIGKSALIAQKIVASLNSTGTPSIYLHAGDALHGDVGMVQPEDIVMIVSKSGENQEITLLAQLIKNFKNTVIALCGNSESTLVRSADIFLNTTVKAEACPNNLAPTSSTTAQMVMGDALAVCLMKLRGFEAEDFAKFHPGGTLGKKLYLRVVDLYVQNERPEVKPDSGIKDVIIAITKSRLGAAVVTSPYNEVVGIITDGDLRRMLEKNISGQNIFDQDLTAKDIMSRSPKSINPDELAIEALNRMRANNITQLVVADENGYKGIIHLHDLVREGII